MKKIGMMARGSLALLVTSALALADQQSGGELLVYENPAIVLIPGGGQQTNCADPTVIRGGAGDPYWYALCTSDSLSDDDVDPSGVRRQHLIPMMRTKDFVSWVYAGDAFTSRPSWVAPNAGLWAPDVVYRNGQYYLYYVATDVADDVSGEPGCGSDNAIGVATSASPTGPWTDSGHPVVPPRRAGGGCNFFWTYDPDVLVTGDHAYLYYGSYYGGLEVRELAADGLTTGASSPIAIPNRYEGANVVEKDGSYWLFASASNCCNGPLTGYQVFAGRSDSPLGPFVDRDGVSFLAGRVGGTPFIAQNGNRWVGAGHNSVFRDAAGDWWSAYHAVDQTDPYFEDATGYTRRPMLIDRVTWDEGWPELRHGLGPSDSTQLAPTARGPRPSPGERLYGAFLDALDPSNYLFMLDHVDPSRLPAIASASDDFAGATLDPKWSWVRPPPAGDAALENGSFRMATEAADLYQDSNNASVLLEAAPPGNWIVQVKLDLDVPAEGCCFNYVQGGLVVYANDDAYVKLTQTSIWETRQTEFSKEIPSPLPGFPMNGTSVGAPPSRVTWLRIAKVSFGDEEHYVSYASLDGLTFRRGAVWNHALGSTAKIGLVAFGGTGFTARFDDLRAWKLPSR